MFNFTNFNCACFLASLTLGQSKEEEDEGVMQLKENEQERKDRTGEMALGIKGLLHKCGFWIPRSHMKVPCVTVTWETSIWEAKKGVEV